MASFLSDLTGGIADNNVQQPQYKATPQDEHTVSEMQNINSKANMSAQDMAASTMGGAENAGQGMLKTPEEQQQNHLGGNLDPSMTGAINARAQRHFGSDVNQLSRTAQTNAQGDKATNLNNAFNLQNRLTRRNMEMEQRQVQADMNAKAQRNSVIGSVLGGIGSVVGAIFGGAQGAQAGGKASGFAGGGQAKEI